VNGVRGDFNGNWSGFTGQINVTSLSGADTWRVNNSIGFPNARVNLATGVTLHNRVGSTPTISIGELSGAANSKISAPGGSDGLGVTWRIGGLNTTATFAGNISNAVNFIKEGGGTWILTGTNGYSGSTTISGGGLQIGSGGAIGTLGTGNVIDNASLVFNRSGTLSYGGAISGSGSVTKQGSGVLLLSGTNTFVGATTISAGTLALTNSGSLANSTNLNVAAGALLNVSGLGSGNLTLASGQTLSGNGSIKGDLIVGAGARLTPGSSIGALIFSNSITLAAASSQVFEISKTPLTNDSVRVFGALTNGGALVVTNLAGALAAGDSFTLFNALSYNGGFASVTLPPLAGGLVWDTSLLNSAGKLKVVSVMPPRITGFNFEGSHLIFSGTGGVANLSYRVLSTTNLALSLNQWFLVGTNQFDSSGAFSYTNQPDPDQPQEFYLLQTP
jgi:fibronectin-binding autotransporter adhesin